MDQYNLKKLNNLPVILNRLVKQKKLTQLAKGWYALSETVADYEALACELVQPSYISFEYALHLHNIMDQVPNTITLATTKKSRNFNLGMHALENINKTLLKKWMKKFPDYTQKLIEKIIN